MIKMLVDNTTRYGLASIPQQGTGVAQPLTGSVYFLYVKGRYGQCGSRSW
ncbi:MAG: hypothetical protein J0H74_15730 [Chitinophagaceae bacterium]|nr:hypothetical protein [Chitinophagaceae bacterium]